MNELLLLLMIALCLIIIFIFNKLFEKRGLYFGIVLLSLISFVLSFKIGYIFKMNINLGIIPFISLLSIIYLYIIKYGHKKTNDLVIVSLISYIVFALLLTLMNYYIPAITETISINMQDTFETNYKIIITYPIIMTLSEYIVIKLYQFIREVANNIFISIILNYIITALLYTIIFCIISYIGILNIKDSIYLGITTYILGLVIQIIHIIFILLLTKGKKVKK